MSRITGSEAKGLMEAYNAVYASHEVVENQIQEDFETWVNSLVEEGYDLSEYTWDEMYETYISEAIGQKGSAGMVSWKDKNTGEVRSGYKSSSDTKLYKNYNDALAARNSRLATLKTAQNSSASAPSTAKSSPTPASTASKQAYAQSKGKYYSSSDQKTYKNYNDALAARNSRLATLKTAQTEIKKNIPGVVLPGDPRLKVKPAPAPAGAPAAGKPPAGAPPSAKPPAGAPAAAKPAATPAAKPQLGPTGKPLVGGIERRTPTRAEMDAAAAKRTSTASPSSAIQAAGQSAGQKAFSTPVKPSTTTTAFKAPTIDVATKPDTSDVKKVNQAAAAPKPITPNPSATSTKPGDGKPYKDGPLREETVDIFDIVMDHLISEGYAETEDAAVVIMANMSEEWKQSIVEQNAIVTTGTSTNAAGEKIPWTHRVEPSGRRTVKDRFGERELREPKLKGA
jgi:hypothetical protein